MENRCAIGVDLGGTNIKAARVAANGKIEKQTRRATRTDTGAEGIADTIAELVQELGDGVDLVGVGIGIPGVTTEAGVVVIAPNLNWHDVPFKALVASRIDHLVVVDNDANVAALAEARVGAGAGCDALVMITLGTGIGGGVVIQGQIHHGASHSAGEVGHMCVLPDGPLCGCGKRGCLEVFSAGPAMVRFVKKGLDAGQKSVVGDDLTPEQICFSAASGDALCVAAVAQAGKFLGIAAANLTNVLSPNVIAIGGGISAAGDVMMKPILASAREHTLKGLFEHTQIKLATLGNDAGSIGAAFLVL